MKLLVFTKNHHFWLACLETLPGVASEKTRPHSRPSEYIHASRQEEMCIAPKYWNPKTNNCLMIRKKIPHLLRTLLQLLSLSTWLRTFHRLSWREMNITESWQPTGKTIFWWGPKCSELEYSTWMFMKKWVWFNHEENINFRKKEWNVPHFCPCLPDAWPLWVGVQDF